MFHYPSTDALGVRSYDPRKGAVALLAFGPNTPLEKLEFLPCELDSTGDFRSVEDAPGAPTVESSFDETVYERLKGAIEMGYTILIMHCIDGVFPQNDMLEEGSLPPMAGVGRWDREGPKTLVFVFTPGEKRAVVVHNNLDAAAEDGAFSAVITLHNGVLELAALTPLWVVSLSSLPDECGVYLADWKTEENNTLVVRTVAHQWEYGGQEARRITDVVDAAPLRCLILRSDSPFGVKSGYEPLPHEKDPWVEMVDYLDENTCVVGLASEDGHLVVTGQDGTTIEVEWSEHQIRFLLPEES